jgi:hypothetical protein
MKNLRYLVLLAAVLSGCAATDGAYDGVVAGVNTAVSSLIQAPVDYFLSVLFP